jgi:hypothetical protein
MPFEGMHWDSKEAGRRGMMVYESGDDNWTLPTFPPPLMKGLASLVFGDCSFNRFAASQVGSAVADRPFTVILADAGTIEPWPTMAVHLSATYPSGENRDNYDFERGISAADLGGASPISRRALMMC